LLPGKMLFSNTTNPPQSPFLVSGSHAAYPSCIPMRRMGMRLEIKIRAHTNIEALGCGRWPALVPYRTFIQATFPFTGVRSAPIRNNL
jgi:hypothetical protein